MYLEPTGLAAARIDVVALRVVMMPTLAMETVCCSYINKCSEYRKTDNGSNPYHDFM